tara:strand:+ start:551 stop:733 length:183 start_codon:yes stop_codon:yes gene_type:complete
MLAVNLIYTYCNSNRKEVVIMAHKIGRSAKTGKFTSVKKAQQYSSTHVVETIKTSNKKGK